MAIGLNMSSGGIGLDLGGGYSNSGGGSIYSLGSSGGQVPDFLSGIGGYSSGGAYASDQRFVQKMNQGAGASGAGGFQGLLDAATFGITYGFQRAIDSRYGPPSVNKTDTQGTYAGQNGQTYAVGQGSGNQGGGVNLLPLLLIGGAVYFLATAK